MAKQNGKSVMVTTAKRSAKLPSGLTVKQEAFAKAVADGHNLASAYRLAYDVKKPMAPSVYVNAQTLRRHSGVAMRIAEIQGELIEEFNAQAATRAVRVVATLESLMRSAKSDRDKIKCAELLGKSVGLFTDQAASEAKKESTLHDLESRLSELMGQIK